MGDEPMGKLRLSHGVGAIAVATAVIASACGSDNSTSTGEGAATTAAPASSAAASSSTEAPKTASNVLVDLPTLPVPEAQLDTESTARFALPFVEATLDPHKVRQNYMSQYVYDQVFQVDKDKNIRPGIGTSFKFSDDLKSVEIKLRDGAVFSDGTPVDANAVKASLDRGRTLADSSAKADLANISAVTAVDPHTVRIDLTEPNVTLIYTLTTHAGSVINPKAIAAGTDLSMTAAGSTPYDITSFEPGKHVVFTRRPGAAYWDPAAFKIKQLDMAIVTDPNTVMNGLRTGAFDFGQVVSDPNQVKAQLGDQFDINLLTSDAVLWIYLRDTRLDKTVRQAFLSGLDRKTIAANALVLCAPTDQIVDESSAAFVKGYVPFPYDSTAARSTLNGATPAVEVIAAPTQANETKVAQIAQQQLGDIGFNLTITPFALAEASPQFISGNRDSFIQASSPLADPAMTIQKFWLGPNALAGPETKPTVQAMMKKANALPLGSPERAQALQDLQKFVLETATGQPVCRLTNQWITTKKLLGTTDIPSKWQSFVTAKYMVLTK
jgi:peptide/nickel transport system substrate-binding protein